MIAYVFWHVSAAGVDGEDYEHRLLRFHDALVSAPPAGFLDSSTHRVDAVPWLDGGSTYEDWYLVADFAALGDLNDAAIEGARRVPHAGVAAAAAAGTAGIYRRWLGHPSPDAAISGRHRWFAKPPATTYEDLRAELVTVVPEGAVVWQRQMTLGPAPEFCLVEAGVEAVALPWPTLDVHATRLRGT